jgi:hypothetical protein
VWGYKILQMLIDVEQMNAPSYFLQFHLAFIVLM